MKTLIEKLFNIKILSGREYNFLLDRIVEMGKMYREADEYPNDYHHGFRTAQVSLNDLSTICTIENIFWDDVKDRLHGQSSRWRA